MRRALRAALLFVGSAALCVLDPRTPTAAAQELSFQSPRLTREKMESALSAAAKWRFIYGTREPAAEHVLRERALLVARRLFGGDSSWVLADRDAELGTLSGASVLLVGGPKENSWSQRLVGALPVRFGAASFEWQGTAYARRDEAITLVRPNPLASDRFLILMAGNSIEAMSRRGGFFFGEDDWRITRGGDLVRSGSFAQDPKSPWRYDAARDHDCDAERERFVAGLLRTTADGLSVRAPAGVDVASVHTRAVRVMAECDRIGLQAPAGAAPLSLTVYASLEQKGEMTRDTRPEHGGVEGGHVALPAGRTQPDLWTIAAGRLRQVGAGASRFTEPASIWLAGRFEGETLPTSIARLHRAGLLPSAAEAASNRGAWRSPLRVLPARAVLVRAIWESASAASRRGALLSLTRREPPGTLDSLCAVAGVRASDVTHRYAAIAAAIAERGAEALAVSSPRPWTTADRFQRGVCLAHFVRMQEGYVSRSAASELVALRERGADWVSLTPFGYLRSLQSPEIASSSMGGPDEETDESIVECAGRARALGMRVWLKPHLWSRGWIGELAFTDRDWERFFEHYREFLLHWAILADRERIDGLFVGHELVSSTRLHGAKWRALIGDVRRVYRGTLTYGANWDEVGHIDFWDALDLVSVSFYSPIAEQPTRDVRTLRKGVHKALTALREVSVRTQRPVLLSEVGYAPTAAAAMKPWSEGEGAIDLETQRACYEALISGIESDTWIAGVFWWKWFTSPGVGGSTDGSFTPKGKPAEAEMTRALRAWDGRPVRAARSP